MVNVGVKLRDKERNRGTFMALKKKPVTGMKDILPAEMQIRDYVLNQIKETYRGFGFSAIETPCVEHIENLTSKQGGDNEKLIFKILKRGEKLNVEAAQTEAAKTKKKAKSVETLTSSGYKLFERLKKLRLEIAREESMPPYIIFSDKTLIDMAAKMPASKPEMLDVSGVGENKFAKYGERFLEVIEEYRREVG